MQTMTLEQFRATVDAGGVLSVTLKAQGAGFMVNVETRRGDAVMVRTRDKAPRRFVDPRKAMVLLRELGIREARVDAREWRPEETEFERQPRPDRREALKAAHEALSHSEWLRAKLAKAAADTRSRVPHEQVMDEAQALIDKKRLEHAKKTKA